MQVQQTMNELKDRAYKIIKIPFRYIDKTGRLKTGKGAVGTMIEESWFGQPPHNDENPDFVDLGVKLKVAPFIRTKVKKEPRAKERLVCNMINYMTEHEHERFKDSSFYRKCNSILLMFYQHLYDRPKLDYKISYVNFMTLSEIMKEKNAFFFLIPDEDIEMMRQDWEKIVNKIKSGKAHEISEGDTNYLGACTKSSDSSKRVDQPFSTRKAKPRAFSIKQSYMSYVLNNYVIIKEREAEALVPDAELLKKKTFDDIIVEKFKPYFGKTESELCSIFGVNRKSKNYMDRIIAGILRISGSINKSAEFQKASITSKIIKVEKTGNIKEHMSFPKIDFNELIKEKTWEDSEFYKQIGLSRFMFSIFVKNGNEYKLSRIKFWNMPNKDLNYAKKVWKETQRLVKKDEIEIGGVGGYSVTNFPTSTMNKVSHVRPHDTNMRNGKVTLPSGKKIANYCFWLNKDYIKKSIKK